MRYKSVRYMAAEDFKRLTGVKPEVFAKMLGVMKEAEARKVKAGRRSKLSLED